MGRRALAGTKKGADAGRDKLLFGDESAFYLLPGVVKTWAPVGQTPVIRHKLTRNHLSVIRSNLKTFVFAVMLAVSRSLPVAGDLTAGEYAPV